MHSRSRRQWCSIRDRCFSFVLVFPVRDVGEGACRVPTVSSVAFCLVFAVSFFGRCGGCQAFPPQRQDIDRCLNHRFVHLFVFSKAARFLAFLHSKYVCSIRHSFTCSGVHPIICCNVHSYVRALIRLRIDAFRHPRSHPLVRT